MNERQRALQVLLRSARARTNSESCGIPAPSRKRSAGLTSAQLAELIGVSQTWYARFEAGRARMSIKALNRLADALHFDDLERTRVLQLAVPELEYVSKNVTARPMRELLALRRFQRRAEAASSRFDLIETAVTAIEDGLPECAFASAMWRGETRSRWLHRSMLFPDVAAAINDATPIDDETIAKARLEQDGLRFIGCPDYSATPLAHLQDRKVRTALQSGFGVRVWAEDCFLGYCRRQRGHAETSHILFVHGVASTVAMTLHWTNFTTPEDAH
jgi:transcriptional regulator with XRE-family HTH domain